MPDEDLDAIRAVLTPPARRAVNELKLQISELAVGMQVGATFRSPVFGVYQIWGEIMRASSGDLSISVASVESKGRPVDGLLRLAVAGHGVAATGPADAAPALAHGTTVRATFTNGASSVHILGPAVVATHSPMIGVGGWVLAYRGTPGVHLRALDVLAGPGELGLACPAPTASWDDAAEPAR
ncbi:hypothetical protein [uncultured Mycolicibacterium sp.]|uniref:hypothetical protein n=1 Tax=uncultured Mycolicibacterium sp. TaxID=2320817 RepID=UPI002601DD24|nr:hypothetical protein [uncultured Mycolicibacterium sp.]